MLAEPSGGEKVSVIPRVVGGGVEGVIAVGGGGWVGGGSRLRAVAGGERATWGILAGAKGSLGVVFRFFAMPELSGWMPLALLGLPREEMSGAARTGRDGGCIDARTRAFS
jgi:hypothetical protein